MKESEFIELLNLYLDHEISAADAARLEAEVATNPARRRIYQDYCRIQKACKSLAVDFATEPVPTAAERNIVAFESARPSQRRAGWYGAGVFVAAAACVAVIFLGRQHRQESEGTAGQGQASFAQADAPAASTAVGANSTAGTVEAATAAMFASTSPAPAAAAAAPTAVPAELAFTTDTALIAGVSTVPVAPQARAARGMSLATSPTAASEALLVAAEQNAAQFEWLHTVKLDPVQRVQIDQFRFNARAPRAIESQPAVVRGAPQGVMVESAAFKITK